MSKQAKIMAVLGLLVLCGSVLAQDSGLIAHWKFDEGSGTTAYDSAGDNDGAIYGAQWIASPIDGALSFDGVGDYVNCSNDISLDFTDAITIGAWVKRPNFGSDGLIAGKTNGDSRVAGYSLFSYTDGLEFNFYSGAWPWQRTTPRVTISANEWHHVVGTFDGNNAYLYVDGNESASLAYSGTIAAATGYSFHISFWRPGLPEYFNGSIDEVVVYNRALSAEEVQQLYQSGLPDVVGLEITGPEQVRENYQAQYKALAYYDDGQARDVTDLALWQVEPNTIASIDTGLLQTKEMYEPRDITIYAQYSEREFTVESQMMVQVSLPLEIEIIGPERVKENCPIQYKALAYYEDGQARDVTDLALWQVEPQTIADIDANGLLHTEDIDIAEDITISVGYLGLETQMTVQVLVPPYVWYVPADYETIQEAIDATDDYGMVLVADGTYTGPGNRDIDFLGKAITVRSENGPENCIIDCEQRGSGFYFYSGEDGNSVLDGFTITNGHAYYGGGIYCGWYSSPTIINCTITGNVASKGGGIACRDGSPTITNCTITDNMAEGRIANGGGIYFYCMVGNEDNCTFTITNCTISGNSTKYYGGGICCGGSGDGGGGTFIISNCTISNNSAEGEYAYGGGIYCGGEGTRYGAGGIFIITNCTINGNAAGYAGGGILCDDDRTFVMANCIIAENTASNGGGIYFYKSNPTINNCTFAENSSPNGSALACYSYHQKYPSNLQLTNCILRDSGDEIWNNDDSNIAITYSDIQGGWPGIGNINADPCFVEPGYWDANDTPDDVNDDFWIEGDYYLLPDSLCIDTGDPNYIPEPNETDIDGNPRVSGDAIDMGAYESNYIQAAMKLTPQMLNCNSKGKYVKTHLALPEGFLPEDVDVNAPAIAEPIGAESEYIKVLGTGTGPVRLEICFDREAFCDGLTETGEIEITVIGSLTTSRYFYATDTIKIKPRR